MKFLLLTALLLPGSLLAQALPENIEGNETRHQAVESNFGPHSTCKNKLVLKATDKRKLWEVQEDWIKQNYPSYKVLDQHSILCDGRKTEALVLFSLDQPSAVVMFDIQDFKAQ